MLLCTYTPFFSLFLALLSGVAVFEIERVAQVKNKAIMGISVAFSALLPVLISAGVNLPVPLVAIGYTILLLILMLAQYEITRFEHVAIALFVSLGIPLAFSCMIFCGIFIRSTRRRIQRRTACYSCCSASAAHGSRICLPILSAASLASIR